ncbi:MAG TPA: type IV-A pilus assembly ATPase PilB [Terriglobia bacterium]|nr:type IV-A pilus assembly ATPase PilB [Terriglobia bacterium]
MSEKLGEILVGQQLISSQQLDQALDHQKTHGGRLGKALVGLGFIGEDDLMRALARQYGVPAVNLSRFPAPSEAVRLIPVETATKYDVLPLSRVGTSLTLAMVDPTNVFAMDQIKFMTGFNVEPVVVSEMAMTEAINKYFTNIEEVERQKEIEDLVSFIDEGQAESVELEATEEAALDLQMLEKEAAEAPVIRLVNYILADAVKRGASDIHLEPYENEYRIRYRIDGLLQKVMSPPIRLRDAVVSRAKIMAKLDISEKRLPQDGRIMIRMMLHGRKKQIDFRVSVLPTLHGEKIVMRLLDKENLRLDMTKLGFEPESLAKFQKAIFKPYGIVLVTGPTGSGKTNTLYSSIVQLNKPEVNIVTAEDPVEFQFPGINQVQMKEQIGLNFAAALRSFLRQDPNIILVGEIRDFETAEIAIKAALTGHLVLSTLHTNDAPSTVSRLMNMGIEPFLVATSVNLIAAQRLVRRVCPNCKTPDNVSPQVLIDAGFTPEEASTVRAYKGRGCNHCSNRGYKGRVALYEVMEVTEELRNLILVGASALELRRQAVEQGMITLRRSGLIKVAGGVTTIEEVMRETVL